MHLPTIISRVSPFVLLLLHATLPQSVQGLNIPKQVPRDNKSPGLSLKGVQWHESCDDKIGKASSETKKTAVTRAWDGGLQLVDSSWNRFKTKTYPVLQKGKNGPLEEEAQNYVNEKDPSYVRLFALDWSPAGVERVKTTLEKLATQANAEPGTNGRPENSIININCEESRILKGEELCDGYAVTIPAENKIQFCPSFFKRQRFDQFLEKFNAGNEQWVERWYNSPGYPGTDAQTVVHELTHLKWLGETNTYNGQPTQEIYGLDDCSEAAWRDPKPIADNEIINLNADTFAWYAELGFWIDKGLPDLWPSWADNPVDLPVSYDDDC